MQYLTVTKLAETVTNILKLSPTHFVSNMRHQYRCYHDTSGENCVEIITIRKNITRKLFPFDRKMPYSIATVKFLQAYHITNKLCAIIERNGFVLVQIVNIKHEPIIETGT